MKNYILGSDILGAEPSDEVGALFGDASFQVATHGTETREGYEGRVRGYFLGRGATEADIQNYMRSFGDSFWRKPSGGYSAPLSTASPYTATRAPLYAASATTAARGCHADGMTIWHYLFFVAVFAAIFFAPRIFVYAKRKFFSSPTKTDLADAMPSTAEGRTS